MYKPIDQDAVVLKRSSKGASAQKFLDWLRHDPQAIAVIKAAGYRISR